MLRSYKVAQVPCRNRTIVGSFTKKAVSSHDVVSLIESFNDRWQRISCPQFVQNEINFLPRRGHTLVAKIRRLTKFREWGDTVHVEIRQCEIPR